MRIVVIVAVLPEYRRNFLEEVRREFARSGDDVLLISGDTHLDATVKSSPHPGVTYVKNRPLLGRRLLWQIGALRHARGADVVVADLNPRSITAWLLVLKGRLARTRTLVWGHVLPRKGESARTVPLRRAMRRLADGVISYTWRDAERVRAEDSSDNVWVASNGLYPAAQLDWDPTTRRDRLLFVGRLEPAKKPALALHAFARALPDLPKTARLTLVGRGTLSHELSELAKELGIVSRVDLLGHIGEYDELRRLYSETVASLSPGYAGLSVTQSLGFGVPIIVADREPHAPEIELLTSDTGAYFESDNADSLARAMRASFFDAVWNHEHIVDRVKSTYSSTSMARGFVGALRGQSMRVS